MRFIAELRRRNVIRMAGLYLVGAWLITQVTATVLPLFGAPDWMARSVIVVLAIGFIPALVIAWVFELTPSGLKRDADVSEAQSIAPQTARRMDRTIIVVLVLALTYFGFDKFVMAPQREAASFAAATKAVAAEPATPDDKSIAVLPFDDLSPAHDQAYFSDGIAEELLLRWRGMLYLQDGDIARAEPLLQRAYDLGLANTANALSDVAMLRGDAAASERLWVAGSMGLDFSMSREELVIVHHGVFGDAAAKQAAVQALQAVLERMGTKRALPTLPLYLFRLDAPAQGLTVLREREMGERIDSMNWIWTRQGAPIRALPEFDGFLRDFHLPELWDKYGPPDLCKKIKPGEYSCE